MLRDILNPGQRLELFSKHVVLTLGVSGGLGGPYKSSTEQFGTEPSMICLPKAVQWAMASSRVTKEAAEKNFLSTSSYPLSRTTYTS